MLASFGMEKIYLSAKKLRDQLGWLIAISLCLLGLLSASVSRNPAQGQEASAQDSDGMPPPETTPDVRADESEQQSEAPESSNDSPLQWQANRDGHATKRLIALGVVLLLLVVTITRLSVHPFLALFVCSLLLGPASSLTPPDTVEAFLSGFAGTMKWIGVVIVLGALIGELLNESGGTLKIAKTILAAVGTKRDHSYRSGR